MVIKIWNPKTYGEILICHNSKYWAYKKIAKVLDIKALYLKEMSVIQLFILPKEGLNVYFG